VFPTVESVFAVTAVCTLPEHDEEEVELDEDEVADDELADDELDDDEPDDDDELDDDDDELDDDDDELDEVEESEDPSSSLFGSQLALAPLFSDSVHFLKCVAVHSVPNPPFSFQRADFFGSGTVSVVPGSLLLSFEASLLSLLLEVEADGGNGDEMEEDNSSASTTFLPVVPFSCLLVVGFFFRS
jgi:hypothetical protein